MSGSKRSRKCSLRWPKASLWVLCNRQKTCYRVVESKTRESFYEVIPREWKGVLVSDCLNIHDNATPNQQKCYAHHLKAISKAVEAGGDGAPGSYLDRCAHLLRHAMVLRKGWDQRAPPECEEQLRALRAAAQAMFGAVRTDKP